MYCRYAKTTIFDHKKCPLNGGEFYIVSFIGVSFIQRFHCIPKSVCAVLSVGHIYHSLHTQPSKYVLELITDAAASLA